LGQVRNVSKKKVDRDGGYELANCKASNSEGTNWTLKLKAPSKTSMKGLESEAPPETLKGPQNPAKASTIGRKGNYGRR